MKPTLYAGMKQGMITLISRAPNKNKTPYWTIQCECGVIKNITASAIHQGQTRCSNKKHPSRLDHGGYGTPEYKSYRQMIRRCQDHKSNRFYNYGAKGITVCDRWKESFQNFLSDMGPRPENFTLDRIDPLKNYCPENCRWASHKTQQNNRTNNVYLTANGETKTMSQWADDLGIDKRALFLRIKRGWSENDAINRPFRTRAK